MFDIVRRRHYDSRRVLIDSARVLDSPFDDSLVYLSGAQLELLRNVTLYLRRQATYVATYFAGYYLTPDIDAWDAIQAIVADLEESLMGNPNTIWGYEDRLIDQQSETSVGGAYTDCNTDAVAAGYVHKVERWTVQQDGDVPCGVTLYINIGGGDPVLFTAPNLNSGVPVYEGCDVTLKEGDQITFRVWGLPNTKTCTLFVWGYKMVVP